MHVMQRSKLRLKSVQQNCVRKMCVVVFNHSATHTREEGETFAVVMLPLGE